MSKQEAGANSSSGEDLERELLSAFHVQGEEEVEQNHAAVGYIHFTILNCILSFSLFALLYYI